MYYVEFWGGKEEQSGAELLGKLSSQVQRYAPEVGVSQQVVQIVGEELKHQTQVIAEHKMTF